MVRPDAESAGNSSAFTASDIANFPFVSADEFEQDDLIGHGTHVSGSVAGSTLHTPAKKVTCDDDLVMGCLGVCIPEARNETFEGIDPNRLCPRFDCDGQEEALCLGDDVSQTLTKHGGMAQGAKLAVFDIFYGQYSYADFAGTDLFKSCMGAGCKVHSNSYGIDSRCVLGALEVLYDDFMYEVSDPLVVYSCLFWSSLNKIRPASYGRISGRSPLAYFFAEPYYLFTSLLCRPPLSYGCTTIQNPKNLVLFAAGNDGWFTDREVCTANSPGIAKNVLSVGATSSGETRMTSTSERGKIADGTNGLADIDTIAAYSGYGQCTHPSSPPHLAVTQPLLEAAESVFKNT